MKYMQKKKSFSMVGVLMATVIFLLVSGVIVENMVFLIRTNTYKKYFLVGNYLANEGVEVTKSILNRNIEQELAKNVIDNPGEYTNADKRWKVLWDEGISPKSNPTTNPPTNPYATYRFNLSNSNIVESGFSYDPSDSPGTGTFGSDEPTNYKNNPSPSDTNYELTSNSTNGYIQGSGGSIKLYRQIDIIGNGYDSAINESTLGIDLNGDSDITDSFPSPTQSIEVLSTITLVDQENRKYLYQVRELIPRPVLYNP